MMIRMTLPAATLHPPQGAMVTIRSWLVDFAPPPEAILEAELRVLVGCGEYGDFANPDGDGIGEADAPPRRRLGPAVRGRCLCRCFVFFLVVGVSLSLLSSPLGMRRPTRS